MTKTDITIEQAEILVDRLVEELGLIKSVKSNFIKIDGPTKHKLYIQTGKTLRRIDFTVDLPQDDPMRIPLKSPNGSIRCHISPTLESLERALRMLADSSGEKRVENKPRPFTPVVHRPKPVVAPVPEIAMEPIPEGGSLADRLTALRDRARRARVKRLLENDQTGRMTMAEAEAVESGVISLEDLSHRLSMSNQAIQEAIECGVEVEL